MVIKMGMLAKAKEMKASRDPKSEAGRARTDDDGIMSSEAMTGSSTVERS